MKRLLSLSTAMLLAAAVCGSAAAQQQAPTAEQYLELLRQDIKTTKVAVLTEAMGLSQAQADKFWPLYREYDLELSRIGDAQLANIRDYAQAYDRMTDVIAKTLVDRSFQLQQDRLALRKRTFEKMSKEVGAIVAGRFSQIENQLLMLIDLQIQSELPLVEKP